MKKLQRLFSLGPFFLIPALSAISPLIVIPALTHTYGAGGWAAVAIAQSVGMAAASMAELGWSVLGPQRVARLDISSRGGVYMAALASKMSAVAIFAPLSAAISFNLVTEHRAAAALLAAAISAGALSSSWYFVGCNRPFSIIWAEGVPRLALLSVAGVAIYLGAPLEVYGGALLMAIIFTLVASSRFAMQPLWPRLSDFRNGFGEIKVQLPITLGRSISVVYTSLPITLVSLSSPQSVASFAAVERLMRMALSILGGVPSRLQSWIGWAFSSDIVFRSLKSLGYYFSLGMIAEICFFLLASVFGGYVFSHTVEIPRLNAFFSSLLLFLICVSRGYGLSLVAENKGTWIAAANIFAAMVGVFSILSFSGFWGAPGAIAGEILAELAGLFLQAFILHYYRARV